MASGDIIYVRELKFELISAIERGLSGEVDRIIEEIHVEQECTPEKVRLKEQGCRPEEVLGEQGCTPENVHLRKQRCTLENVQLREMGLSIVLHAAVETGNFVIVRLLLEKTDVDVNHVCAKKGSPLHVALTLEPELAVRMCALLIEYGAERTVMNVHRQTPLAAACAMVSSPRRLIELLVDRRSIDRKSKMTSAQQTPRNQTLSDLLAIVRGHGAPNPPRTYHIPHVFCVIGGNLTALDVLFVFEDRYGIELSDDDTCQLVFRSLLADTDVFRRRLLDRLRQRFAGGWRLGDLDLWGALLRSVSKHPLLTCREQTDWAELLLDQGACPIGALQYVIAQRRHDAFDQLRPYLNPDVVARLNAMQHTAEGGGNNFFNMHPFVTAVENNWHVSTLLARGIEFTALKQHIVLLQCRTSELLHLYRDLGLHCYTHCKLLSYLIMHHLTPDLASDHANRMRVILSQLAHSVEDDAHRRDNVAIVWRSDDDTTAFHRLLELLLEHGAQPNVEASDQLPPLCALAFVTPTEVQSQTDPVRRTANILLHAGANPFYASFRFRGTVSRAVPDVVLIAALVGNIPFLRFLLCRVGFDTAVLIHAMEEQVCDEWKCPTTLPEEDKVIHRSRVAVVVRAILPFTVKHNPRVKGSCDRIGEHLRSRFGASEELFLQELSSVQSLQSLARVAIRNQLQRSVNVNDLMHAKVERITDIPNLLTRYLLFNHALE